MNGAESLARTLVAGGVNVCFTNPGTSEMHFVAALDKHMLRAYSPSGRASNPSLLAASRSRLSSVTMR